MSSRQWTCQALAESALEELKMESLQQLANSCDDTAHLCSLLPTWSVRDVSRVYEYCEGRANELASASARGYP
eukprot:5299099-Karenia_brevis.AAC.1